MPRPPPVVPFIQTGNPEMDRLQRFVTQALPGKQDNWVAPAFLNGWINFSGAESTAGFYKDSNGRVWVRGLVKSGTVNTAVFTLPIGYRPLLNQYFGSLGGDAGGTTDVWHGLIVKKDGTVSQTGAPGTKWFSLSCSFDTR